MDKMDKIAGDDRPRISYGRETRKVGKKDLARANIGKVFWSARSDMIQDKDVQAKVMRYRERIDEMVRTGTGVVFTGGPGVGKTSAAACLLKQAIARGLTSYFVTHDELFELAFDKSGRLFGDGSDGVTVKQKINSCQFLILDNFNSTFLTSKVFGPDHLERLLTKRSSAVLTTVLTTRVAASLKRKEYADLFDVISNCMAPMQISGKNMRDDSRRALMERVHGGDDV